MEVDIDHDEKEPCRARYRASDQDNARQPARHRFRELPRRQLQKNIQINDTPEPSLLALCHAWLADRTLEIRSDAGDLADPAARHGLLGIVHRSGKDLPEALRRTARRAYEEHAAMALLLRLQLEEIGAAFTREGIPLIALKGAAAALSLLSGPGLPAAA
jgi:hypothetical protein